MGEQWRELGAQTIVEVYGKDHSDHCLLLDDKPKHEGGKNTQMSCAKTKGLHLNHAIPTFEIFIGLSF